MSDHHQKEKTTTPCCHRKLRKGQKYSQLGSIHCWFCTYHVMDVRFALDNIDKKSIILQKNKSTCNTRQIIKHQKQQHKYKIFILGKENIRHRKPLNRHKLLLILEFQDHAGYGDRLLLKKQLMIIHPLKQNNNLNEFESK